MRALTLAPQLGVSQAQIDAALGEHNAVSAAGDLAIGPQRIRALNCNEAIHWGTIHVESAERVGAA